MESLELAIEQAKTLGRTSMIGCNQDRGKYDVVIGDLDFNIARENRIIVNCTCVAGEINYVDL